MLSSKNSNPPYQVDNCLQTSNVENPVERNELYVEERFDDHQKNKMSFLDLLDSNQFS